MTNNSGSPDKHMLGPCLFALSFGALFLELLMIRWVPSQVRLVAYYANLMLISSFLGLGVGAMVGSRDLKLTRFFLPTMIAMVLFILLCSGMAMPGSAGEARFFNAPPKIVGYVVLVGIFAINTLMFIPIGAEIGRIFGLMPPLRAYCWDLIGSLSGTVLFGLFSIRIFSPLAGFAVVIVIYFLAFPLRLRTFDIGIGIALLGIVAISSDWGAVWSPYHYLTVHDPWGNLINEPEADHRTRMDPTPYVVRVNQDIYQAHTTINPARYTSGSKFSEMNRYNFVQYPLPYTLRPDVHDALVLGAGGGTDVEAALLAGAKSVDAVEIDPAILKLSEKYSPSNIYHDPRVHVHVEDARTYLQRTGEQYDAVIFGFLDSQNLFSYGSNLRLDGYIYTVECFQRAFGRVRDGGLLSVSFSVPQNWVAEKLAKMLKQATGVEPIVFQFQKQYVLLAPKFIPVNVPDNVQMFQRVNAIAMSQSSWPLASDDWPYLYLSQRRVPVDYCIVIGTLLCLSTVGIGAVRKSVRIDSQDAHFFFLGAGFLLLQTKSIQDCSLYFGTTWVVSVIVISGTLLMVLAANLIAMRLRETHGWFYIALLISVLALLFTDRQAVLAWSIPQRLAWAIFVVPLPIFFAGLIFSTTFRAAKNPSACFGANLIGATIGGFCEYLGMWLGFAALSYIVIAAYAFSAVCLWISRRRAISVQ